MFKSNTVYVPPLIFDAYFKRQKSEHKLSKAKALVRLVEKALVYYQNPDENILYANAVSCSRMDWHRKGVQVTLVNLVYEYRKDGSPSWEQIEQLQELMNAALRARGGKYHIPYVLTFFINLAFIGLYLPDRS